MMNLLMMLVIQIVMIQVQRGFLCKVCTVMKQCKISLKPLLLLSTVSVDVLTKKWVLLARLPISQVETRSIKLLASREYYM